MEKVLAHGPTVPANGYVDSQRTVLVEQEGGDFVVYTEYDPGHACCCRRNQYAAPGFNGDDLMEAWQEFCRRASADVDIIIGAQTG